MLDLFKNFLTSKYSQSPSYELIDALKSLEKDDTLTMSVILAQANAKAFDKEDLGKLLIKAAKLGHTNSAELLLKAGADVNIIDNFRRYDLDCFTCTPLMEATMRGNIKLVRILLKAGADTTITERPTTQKGFTAFLLAAKYGHSDIVEEFINAGVNIDETDGSSYDFTALEFAAMNGHGHVIQLLIKAGAKTKRALYYAVKHSQIKSVKALIEAKVDPNPCDWDQTPLELAVRDMALDIIKELLKAPGIKVTDREIGAARFNASFLKDDSTLNLLNEFMQKK